MTSVIEPDLLSHADTINELCRRFFVHRLDIFGSAVTEHFNPASSDFDFLVSFEPLTPAAYANAYFGLRDGLEATFGRDVDLVTDAGLTNPYFRKAVLASRRRLFQSA